MKYFERYYFKCKYQSHIIHQRQTHAYHDISSRQFARLPTMYNNNIDLKKNEKKNESI